MGHKEGHNHFVNNPRGTVVTPEMIMAQVERYNQKDPVGQPKILNIEFPPQEIVN
jgi:hypothetical protein